MSRTATIALVLASLSTTAAQAAPRRSSNVEIAEAQDALDDAKASHKLPGHKLKLAKARLAARKSWLKLARELWVSECITERTGPRGGIAVSEAALICADEVPGAAELIADPDLTASSLRAIGAAS